MWIEPSADSNYLNGYFNSCFSLQDNTTTETSGENSPPEESSSDSTSGHAPGKTSRPFLVGAQQLTQEEKQEIAQLRQRDRHVRAHEAAHVAAGGPYVRGGANFSYQTGPDGKRYAVGGEVSIDTSPVRNNPEATIVKMQTVRRAALAPADPSGQDRAVAAAASALEARARQELASEQSTKSDSDTNPQKPTINENRTVESRESAAVDYFLRGRESSFQESGRTVDLII